MIDLKGIPVRLTDTAGVRESGDAIENEGIARTGKAIESADLVIALYDGSRSPDSELLPELSGGATTIHILNKADLGIHPGWKDLQTDLTISCTTREGIVQLASLIAERALGGAATSVNPVAINARHQDCLRRAAKDLAAALAALHENQPPEIVAIEIRAALDAVGEVVGKTDNEDLLGEIFSSFCIGK